MEYLGHVVSEDGVAADLAKLAAVRDWPVSKNAQDVRVFLGLANYYQRMVRGFASLAVPLTDLLRKDV